MAQPAFNPANTMIIKQNAAKVDSKQLTVFTNWANYILRRRGFAIHSIETDLSDGIMLIQMAELLTDKQIPKYNKNPKLLVHKIENITIATKHFQDHGFDTSSVSSSDIARGSTKPILGLFWLMISSYQLKDLRGKWGDKQDGDDKLEADIAELQAERDKAERKGIEAKQKAEEEARRKAEEEARRKAEEDARRKAEEEARRKAEEDARRKAEEEARRKAEEEARRKAEEEARRKAEEDARRKAEEEARRKAEEDARRKAEEDARRKAEEEARRKAEEDARRKKAEEEARLAEEARRKAEEERRKAEEARRKAEEERRKAEDAKRMAEDERKRAEEERRKAELEEKKRAAAAEFDNKAKEYKNWANDVINKADKTEFNEKSLKVLDSQKSGLEAEEKAINAQNDAKKKELEILRDEAQRLGANTQTPWEDVPGVHKNVQDALKRKKAKFDAKRLLLDAVEDYENFVKPVIAEMERKNFGSGDPESYQNQFNENVKRWTDENNAQKKKLDDIIERNRSKDNAAANEAAARSAKLNSDFQQALSNYKQAYEDKVKKSKADKDIPKGAGQLVRRAATKSEAAFPCKKCKLPVQQSNVVLVDDKDLFHATCFVCTECKSEFKQYYWEHDDQPYCFDHYAKLENLFCSRCKKVIEDDKFIKALKTKWHKKCFTCVTCDKLLSKKQFYGDNDQPYCKKDYYKSQGLLCARCEKPVGNGDKSALGKAWHKTCWYCTGCNNQFGTGGFFNVNGFPYCPDCKDNVK